MAAVGALQLVRITTKVVSLPEVFIKIDTALRDPNTTNQSLDAIISADPGLAAQLLKLANSSLFCFAEPIASIAHAISIVGTTRLRDLVLATSIVKLFAHVPSELLDMESFWRHSLSCGLLARALAGLHREENLETFFLGGLLHDIGKLVLLMHRPETMANILVRCRDERTLMSQLELEVLGFTHAKLGGLLLREWRVPTPLREAVMYHHAPRLARHFPIKAGIVQLADTIANAFRLGSSGEQYAPPVDEVIWQKLNFPEQFLDLILPTVQEQYQEIAGIILGEEVT